MYQSSASNIVPGDVNSAEDVFVWDRQTGVTTKLGTSEGHGGVDGVTGSGDASISGDGRWVTYSSDGSSIVGGDDNGVIDVFEWDRLTGSTVKVSHAVDGRGANRDSGMKSGTSISADGRFVTFQSNATNIVDGDSNATIDIFLWDRLSNGITKVTRAGDGGGVNGESGGGVISADGHYVVYTSNGSNIAGPRDDHEQHNVFEWDRLATP